MERHDNKRSKYERYQALIDHKSDFDPVIKLKRVHFNGPTLKSSSSIGTNDLIYITTESELDELINLLTELKKEFGD